ncbi:MAG: hypothetical protein R3F20_05395 [Planctomycetota bacterium]
MLRHALRPCVLVLLVLIGAGPALGQRLYWVDTAGGSIQSLLPDGTGLETHVVGGQPSDIAIDGGGGKMYWTDDGFNEIRRADLDGTSIESVVSGAGNLVRALALDPTAGKVYWTDAGILRRANLDGTSVQVVLTDGVAMSGVALDVAAGKVYYTRNDTAEIKRANLDGSVKEVVVSGASNAQEIALDLAAGKVYWSEPGSVPLAMPGAVKRANLDGTGVETLASGFAIGLTIDPAGGRVYWGENGPAASIHAADLDGSNATTLIATGVILPVGCDFAAVVPEPFPGTGEDLRLGVGINSPPSFGGAAQEISASGGDLVALRLDSPGGTLASPVAAPPFIIADLIATGTDPIENTFFPGVWIPGDGSEWIVLFDAYSQAGGLGVAVLPAGGLNLTIQLPPVVSGLKVAIQGFAAYPVAANGLFAASSATTIELL